MFREEKELQSSLNVLGRLSFVRTKHLPTTPKVIVNVKGTAIFP